RPMTTGGFWRVAEVCAAGSRSTDKPTSVEGDLLMAWLLRGRHERVWRDYWTRRGQPWRTEPLIDRARQRFLRQRMHVVPDVRVGRFPFGGIKLHRADVEWLLDARDRALGPRTINSRLESRLGNRAWGLDLRGADLCGADLRRLPLAEMRGGLA